jgi:tetratricopeptide (TPR) repeat protein
MHKVANAKNIVSTRLFIRHFLTPAIYLLIFNFWPFSSATALNLPQTPSHAANTSEMIRNAIELLNQNRHDSVLTISRAIIKNDPENPIGYFLACDSYQTRMRDYRVKKYEVEMDSLIKIAVNKATVCVSREPTAENYFILGTVKGYYGVHLFQSGNFLKAIKTAENCMSFLKKACKLDSDFVDPLLGMALYDYGKSKVLFGLLGGNKKDAMAKLKIVEKSGRYVSTNAKYSLQAIYFESAQYDSALAINDQLYRRYPENPACLYNRALLLEKANRLTEALDVWDKLLGCVIMAKQTSNGYLAECYYHLAWIHHQFKNSAKAQESLKQAAKFAAQRQADEEMEGSYIKFNDIKKKINTALKNWRD